MKKIIFALITTLLFSCSVQDQEKETSDLQPLTACTGTSTTGTNNDCYLNTSIQGNIHILQSDSITQSTNFYGNYRGPVLSQSVGGTGYSTFSAALAASGVPISGTAVLWSDTLTKIMTIFSARANYYPLTNPNNFISNNQNINFTGDVSGSGSTSVTLSIGAAKVTNT